MAIRTYKVTLDSKNTIAPEPVYLRQGDKTGAVVIDATLMDNGDPVSLDGLTPMFKANTADGKAVIADSIGFNIVNASDGEFTYQVPSQLGSVDGKIKIAYFSFSDSSGAQSTFNVAFIVKKAADMTKEGAKDWVSLLSEIIEKYNQWVNDAHSSWDEFVNANKEIIESIDPGGTLLTEVIAARNGKSNLKTRLDDEHAQVTEQLAETVRVANVKAYGAIGDGIANDTNSIQNAINYVHSNGGGNVYIPRGTYLHNGLISYTGVSIIGESWKNTLLKNISIDTDSISIQGSGQLWPEHYKIANLQLTSDIVVNDTRKGINNYINRFFRYENLKITNHGTGLYERGSWYSEHIGINISNCDIGIMIPAYSIPGTPNSFTDCSIIACRIGLLMETGVDSLTWKGGHIGGCAEKAICLDSTESYNMRNISFDSVNIEGNLGLEDITIGYPAGTPDNGYIHNVIFTNCRFAQWNVIPNKVGVAIYYGASIITLINCYFIGYTTCVVDTSTFANGQTLIENCGMTNSANGFNLRGNIGNFSSINGYNQKKYFSYPTVIENISSILTVHVNSKILFAEKNGNHVKIGLSITSDISAFSDLVIFSNNAYMKSSDVVLPSGQYPLSSYFAPKKIQNRTILPSGTYLLIDYFVN